MGRSKGTVEALGSFLESVGPYAERAADRFNKMLNKTGNKGPVSMDRGSVSHQLVTSNKEQIKGLLKKAGLHPLTFFPFETKINENGEMEFDQKNVFKMAKDAKKTKKQLQTALEDNRITQEEFDMLDGSLNKMLEENGLQKEDIEIPGTEEIEELFETFVRSLAENVAGLIASIGEKTFGQMCEDYEDMDLDERKNGLEKMNSAINKKLKIAGTLKFSTNPNLGFEDGFTQNGYMLTENDVAKKGLKETVKEMMERSMFRKLQTQPNQNLSDAQRAGLLEKIKIEKKVQEEQKRNEEKVRQEQVQRARKMFN